MSSCKTLSTTNFTMILWHASLSRFGDSTDDSLNDVGPLPSHASTSFKGVRRSFICAAWFIIVTKPSEYFVISVIVRAVKNEQENSYEGVATKNRNKNRGKVSVLMNALK